MSVEEWRHVPSRQPFLDDVALALAERQQMGVRRFGTDFHGDPLDHAWQEQLDSLYYIWIAKKERESLRGH